MTIIAGPPPGGNREIPGILVYDNPLQSPPVDTEDLMTAPQVAKYLGISLRHLYRLMNEGLRPHGRFSRRYYVFRKADVDQFVEERPLRRRRGK
ncbi:MAG: helix-turn-helix domain-containing protein [Dehalococcoidia bacterium]